MLKLLVGGELRRVGKILDAVGRKKEKMAK
jgi:hypothetical protein